MRWTRKTPSCEAPTWLDAAVYEPKRQRTFDLVKRAVDMLVEQRQRDGCPGSFEHPFLNREIHHDASADHIR